MSDSINTIVDKQAYEQLDQLREGIKLTRLELVELLNVGSGANIKITGPSDLKKQLQQTSEYQEKVTSSVEKTRLAEIKLQQAREKAFDDYEKKLKKEQEQREKQVKSESDLRQKLAKQKEQQQKRELATIQSLERQKEKSFQKEITLENRKAKQDVQQIENQKILARNAREYAVISSRLSSEYKKQSVILEQLRRKYKDSALLYGENSKEAKKYLREVTELDAKLKKVDSNVGEFRRNVGNYSSAWGKAGSLILSAAAAFGIYSALDIGRQIYKQIKEIDALNKALLQVTETQEAFNQAQMFLYDLGERTGAELNTLQKGYTKFLASAKETNLTLRETQYIYETVATAGAVLGQSTEQVEGAMRALEQMLSKGKIQAEEVRGQLGERLPGAYQILAKSMGLTNQQLDKQLELGNVIADEVLPKFAEELEKTFGLKAVDRVETLNAAQGRLSNSWRTFVEGLSESQGPISQTFKTIFGYLSEFVNYMNLANKSWAELMQTAEDRALAESIKADRDEVEELAKAYLKQGLAVDNVTAKVKAAQDMIKQYQDLQVRGNMGGWDTDGPLAEANDPTYQKNIDALKKYIEEVQRVKKDNEDGGKEVEKRAKVEEILITTYQRSMAAMENYKKYLSEIQSKLATSSKEYAHIQTLIDSVTESMSKLDGSYDFAADIELPEAEALQNFLNNKIPDQAKRLSELLGTEQKALMEEFLSLYEWDYNNWLKFQEMKLKAFNDYGGVFTEKQVEQISNWINEAQLMFTALGDIAAGFSDRRIQQIEREMEANDKMYEKIFANENLSERQRKLTEEQQEKDRERLNKKKEKEQLKQAKMQKAQAALNVVLNTSMAIISALAQIPKFDFGISAGATAALYAATGAAQLAAVLAQPLPKYAKGRNSGKAEWAITGDGGRKEVITDEHDNPKMITPNKPTLTYLPKNYKVYPSEQAFGQKNYDAVLRATVLTSLASQHQDLSSADLGNHFDQELMTETIDRAIREGLRGVVIKNKNYNNNSELADALKFRDRRDV